MKNILLLLIFLSVEKSCDKQDQLPLVKATSQAWAGGAPGSGRGTNYLIYLDMVNTPDYTFDSLWVQDKRLSVSIRQSEATKDTLVIIATDMIHNSSHSDDHNKSSGEIVPVPFPVTGTAEGMLGYHYKGQQKYLVIESWIRLKPLYYP